MNSNYDDIVASVNTSDEANKVISDFETLSASLFSSKKEKVAKKMEKLLPFEIAKGMTRYCKERKIDLEERETCKQLLDEISKALHRLPIITLYLAFSPTEQYVKKLGTLLYGYCKQKVLLEIIVEKVVLGGAVIAWKGVYKDFSLRKTIDEKNYEF